MLGPVRQVATLAAVVLLGAIVAKEVFARGRVGLNRIMGAIALYIAGGGILRSPTTPLLRMCPMRLPVRSRALQDSSVGPTSAS